LSSLHLAMGNNPLFTLLFFSCHPGLDPGSNPQTAHRRVVDKSEGLNTFPFVPILGIEGRHNYSICVYRFPRKRDLSLEVFENYRFPNIR
jgi:hypothetical protein